MALTDNNNGLSAADVAAVVGNGYGNNGFGFGGDGAWWLILFLFAMNGGWGNGGYGGYANIGSEIYPWMNQSQQVNDGFRDQMINSNIQGIQSAVTRGFGDVALGIAGINQNICQASNANQVAMLQGFNGIQSQFANCCCDQKLSACQTNNTIQNEGNMTRFADANNTRDIITNQTASTQAILDKLCQLELDGVKAESSAKDARIADLQNQLNMANMRESQTAQNAFIQQGLTNEVDALYNRLNSCPVPTTPVFGRTPIFTCNSNNGGCGCGNNGFLN